MGRATNDDPAPATRLHHDPGTYHEFQDGQSPTSEPPQRFHQRPGVSEKTPGLRVEDQSGELPIVASAPLGTDFDIAGDHVRQTTAGRDDGGDHSGPFEQPGQRHSSRSVQANEDALNGSSPMLPPPQSTKPSASTYQQESPTQAAGKKRKYDGESEPSRPEERPTIISGSHMSLDTPSKADVTMASRRNAVSKFRSRLGQFSDSFRPAKLFMIVLFFHWDVCHDRRYRDAEDTPPDTDTVFFYRDSEGVLWIGKFRPLIILSIIAGRAHGCLFRSNGDRGVTTPEEAERYVPLSFPRGYRIEPGTSDFPSIRRPVNVEEIFANINFTSHETTHIDLWSLTSFDHDRDPYKPLAQVNAVHGKGLQELVQEMFD